MLLGIEDCKAEDTMAMGFRGGMNQDECNFANREIHRVR